MTSRHINLFESRNGNTYDENEFLKKLTFN